MIVVVGWIIAYLLRYIVRSILRLIRFDKISEHAGAAQLLNKAALPAPSELAEPVRFWLAWLGFILIGISVLDIVGMQEHISNFFGFLPRLFAGLFLLFVGLLAASFFSRAALLAAVNANLPSPRLISSMIRVLIVVFTLSMCFEEIGLAEPPSWSLLRWFLARSCWDLRLRSVWGAGNSRDVIWKEDFFTITIRKKSKMNFRIYNLEPAGRSVVDQFEEILPACSHPEEL